MSHQTLSLLRETGGEGWREERENKTKEVRRWREEGGGREERKGEKTVTELAEGGEERERE